MRQIVTTANGGVEVLKVEQRPDPQPKAGEVLIWVKAAGLNFSHVVKSTIFLKDMASFPLVNQAYGKYFPAGPPARETVEVSRLPKDANVEISCIAIAEPEL